MLPESLGGSVPEAEAWEEEFETAIWNSNEGDGFVNQFFKGLGESEENNAES